MVFPMQKLPVTTAFHWWCSGKAMFNGCTRVIREKALTYNIDQFYIVDLFYFFIYLFIFFYFIIIIIFFFFFFFFFAYAPLLFSCKIFK